MQVKRQAYTTKPPAAAPPALYNAPRYHLLVNSCVALTNSGLTPRQTTARKRVWSRNLPVGVL